MSDVQKMFHPFPVKDNKLYWAGYVPHRMEFFNDPSIIPDCNFGAGFLVATRPGIMDTPHIHDGAHNFFVFTGADLSNFFESEFEVAFCIGDTAQSMEIYHINKPCIVAAPAGVFHSPVYFKKVKRGLNTMLQYVGTTIGRVYPRLDSEGNEEWIYEKDKVRYCIKDPETPCSFCGLCFTDPNETEEDVIRRMQPFYDNASKIGKYKDCIVELRKDYHTLGDAVMSPRCVFKGKEDMPNTVQQFSFNIITKPCVLGDEKPTSNGQVAEFLWFSGCDVVEPWETFDADIEIELGDDPEHMEKVHFSEAGMIAIPPGKWRGAITVKRADKPICFIPFYPSEKPRYKITQEEINGKKVLVYNDETTITNPTPGDELFLQMKRK